jgi:hypothetical protein
MQRPFRFLSMALLLAFTLNAGAGLVESVTFESKSTDGTQPATQPKVVGGSANSGNSQEGALLYSLEAPQDQKDRLADAINGVHLTGIQATMAIEELQALENQNLPDNEILARLVYTEECFDALEKAAKRLNDNVELVKIACERDPELKEQVVAMLEGIFASPAYAFTGDPMADSIIAQEVQGIGRAAKKSFNSFMNTLSSAASTIGNAASKVKNAVSNGIGKVTGAVGKVHTKIGNVVGQKNWATMMAGTKFVCTYVGGTVALIVAAPVTTAGAVGAVVVWTAVNVGAGVSLANDLSQIQGGRGADGLDNALTKVNQTTALIGAIGGGRPGEVFVNVMGVAGNEIVGTTPGQKMTPEEMAGFLEPKDRQEFLKNIAALKKYQKPDAQPTGGDGGGGGGSCGCGGHSD